ncbi:MAG: helix-turn-helix domain-containing protein [Alphaproteobacteria bacterium]
MDRPFSCTTLAERWNVSPQHIHNLIQRGDIQNSFKIGRHVRIPAWEVERIESCGSLNSIEESTTLIAKSTETLSGDLYVPPTNL